MRRSETSRSTKRENRVKHFLFCPSDAPNAFFHRLSAYFRDGRKKPNDKMVVGNKETAMQSQTTIEGSQAYYWINNVGIPVINCV